jgi:ABC-type transporter Mla MlaB component
MLPAALNLTSVPALLADADRLAASGSLDLSPVRELDSAGLAFLLELQRRARRLGTPLRYTGAGNRIRELAVFFEIEPLLQLG